MSVLHRLTIDHVGRKGEGVALQNGRRLYVPRTLPQETVSAHIEGDRATLIEVLEASPERTEPFCPHFGPCGGCSLQHWKPENYRAWKRGLVESALMRAGIQAEVAPILDAHGRGRRRIALHARNDGAGFMTARTHALHDIDRCPILVPELAPAFDIARAVYRFVGDSDVAVTLADGGLDVSIKARRRGNSLRLAPLAAQFDLARLALNGEVIVERAPPAVQMGKARVRLPPGGFLQATAEGEELLAGAVRDGVGRAKRIADLFCGVGPFSLRLAETARVLAVDGDRAALAALTQAFRTTPGLKPIETSARDLFRDPLVARELESFDAVVLDPPRAGAEAQANELAKSPVGILVYVSCDPGTFARDASLLVGGGYRLDRVVPVDQFAWSAHVEIVGVFRR